MPSRKSRISPSVALWPFCTRAFLSSATVIVPEPSTSICFQMRDSSAISFSVRWWARTFRATFFSFDMPTKFCSLFASWSPLIRFFVVGGGLAVVEPRFCGGGGDPPFPVEAESFFWGICGGGCCCSWSGAAASSEYVTLGGGESADSPTTRCFSIHGCFRASAAVMRFMASRSRRFVMNALASGLMSSQSSAGKDLVVRPFFTRSKIATSEFALNGGYPQRRMYVITPIDHRSHAFV
mmetsp:Transcript_30950/g.99851  ORF Transcript_30950/g.99851 Transcript_30950/m.99851 type:complete len:238 (+) Transcript_30950:599-1312(+)